MSYRGSMRSFRQNSQSRNNQGYMNRPYMRQQFNGRPWAQQQVSQKSELSSINTPYKHDKLDVLRKETRQHKALTEQIVMLTREPEIKESPKRELQKKELPKRELLKKESPRKESPIKESSPIMGSPIMGSPIMGSPMREFQINEVPVKEMPIKESPIKELPIKELPIMESPIKELPIKESPIKESPIKELEFSRPGPVTSFVEQQQNVPVLANGDNVNDGAIEETIPLINEALPLINEALPATQVTEGSQDQDETNNFSRKFYKNNKKSKSLKGVQKLRLRMRRYLHPKDAFTVLKEIKHDVKLECVNSNSKCLVRIKCDEKIFEEEGKSISAAKLIASENALKSIVAENMRKKASKDVEMPSADPQTEESADANNGEVAKEKPTETELPLDRLACFALHKLFTEWRSQGVHFPFALGLMRGGGLIEEPGKRLPPNAKDLHPAMLLNQINPYLQYVITSNGVQPDNTYTCSVDIEGKTFKGTATSKKHAKNHCAKEVLKSMGVQYDN